MSPDPNSDISAALQRTIELMREQADRLARSMEDDAPLRKSVAQLEAMAKQLAPNQQGEDVAASAYTGSLSFLSAGESEDNEELYANGIDGTTGTLLLKIDAATLVSVAMPETEKVELNGYGQPKFNESAKSKLVAYGKHESLFDKKDRLRADIPEAIRSALNISGIGDMIADHGVTADYDQNRIEAVGWAVLVHAQEDVAVLKALWPLIDHRMRQMGFGKRDFDFQSGDTTCGAWLSRHTDGGKKTMRASAQSDASDDPWGQIKRLNWEGVTVPPVLLVRSGDSVDQWLARRGVSQAPVDPTRGVPFYLMIVGRPGPLTPSDQVFIPWDFQYELDMFWGVGRLAFTDERGQHRLDDYRAYAERVVAWEQRPDDAGRQRTEIAFFGTRHEGDTSTERSADELIAPLISWSGAAGKIPARMGMSTTVYLGDDATRDNLGRLLSASAPPALLFSATHGIGMPMSDPARLVMNQGALLTADFAYGSIRPEHWLSGADLDEMSNLNVEGMIALLFACYSAGCPQIDEFVFDKAKTRTQIAPFPFVAQLPQRMLANGALAALGHIERAWTYSFSGVEGGADSQSQPFEDVLGRLMRGMPAGSATDQFNVIQGARSLTLTQKLGEAEMGIALSPKLLARHWMARNDARNYVLLGDPARQHRAAHGPAGPDRGAGGRDVGTQRAAPAPTRVVAA
ncbi:hypothetical protein K2Z83_09585 [Oscillochloris sp. ZM17-4]|uniref:C25 family cysteine peptidase n=1 Tax=Oscillochloris sp. ZM17-4 TaxID=2866714 RepID=UPI001C73B856|nr:C25 family cysteine peptidase [Oscillochloris sp. ZM17-4]MBX0327925.1 hypothetical protein [Oscillochloris sp. ZM17-4]